MPSWWHWNVVATIYLIVSDQSMCGHNDGCKGVQVSMWLSGICNTDMLRSSQHGAGMLEPASGMANVHTSYNT